MTLTKFNLRLVKESETEYELDGERVTNPKVAADIFRKVFDMECITQEVFCIMTLDIKNQITGIFEVSRGGLSSSIVHPRDVFQRAILQNAAAIVLCHNHPSGIPDPSQDDIKITRKLYNAGEIMGISVLDHLIVGDNERYHSMKEHGEF